MKRSLLTLLVMVVLSMTSVNGMAQGRGHSGKGRDRVEMRRHDNGRHHKKHKDYRPPRPKKHHDDGIRYGREKHCKRGGWYPGYEGRVRYVGGHWGYRRSGKWYYYDCFYEPEYYFARPLRTFRPHLFTGRVVVDVRVR